MDGLTLPRAYAVTMHQARISMFGERCMHNYHQVNQRPVGLVAALRALLLHAVAAQQQLPPQDLASGQAKA
jgi:hypothetical protein